MIHLRRLLPVMSALVALTFSFSCGGNGPQENPENPYEWNKGKDDPKNTENEGEKKDLYPKEDGAFRIVTYNVGAFHKFITVMNQNIDTVAVILKEVGADVVGLNELDSMNTRHNANQVALLAKALGDWQWYFGKGIDYRGGSYGNGVVVPKGVTVEDKYTVPLPNPTKYESRSIAVVETDKYVLAASHLDHSSEEYIQTQIGAVNAWVQSKYLNCDKPVFFMGDMNSVPGSDAIKALQSSWDVISSMESSAGGTAPPTRCIDYIFHYKKSKAVKVLGSHTITKVNGANVSRASDHLPVYVDVTF